MPLRNLLWLLIMAVVSLACYREAGRNRYAGILSESIDKITKYYVEPVESRALFEGGLRGMLSELDPYSGYISPDDFNQFQVDIHQRFGGIGIEVGIENDRLTILNPVPGTPAYDAGLMAGDVILKIDDENVEGYSLDRAVKLMRGPIGTIVRVEVLRPDETQVETYEIERAEIRVESVRGDSRDRRGHWQFVLEQDPRIGYVRLMSFGDQTAAELKEALSSIKGKVDGLIMDLRGNAGGLLNAAVEICDMFIPAENIIVSTRGRDPSLAEVFWSSEPPLIDPNLPVVVLVDRFSASASEIFAACLQDYQRATIVGERTWGKGTVQNVILIEGGKSAIRLTTQTYWRPSGENIHRHRDDDEQDAWGVRPSPEDTVELDAQEYRRLYEARRARDYSGSELPTQLDSTTESNPDEQAPTPQDEPQRNDAAEADSDVDDAQDETEPTPETPFVDRQLQRAIEVLERQPNRAAA